MSALDRYDLEVLRPGDADWERRSAAEWGVTGGGTKHSGGGDDTLHLTFVGDVRAPAPWPAFTRLRLYSATQLLPVWQGVRIVPTWQAARGRQGQGVAHDGPNVWLAATPFLQDWHIPVHLETPQGDFVQRGLSWVILGGQEQQVSDVINEAIVKVQSEGYPVSLNMGVFPGWSAPEDRVTDIDCLEAIRRVNGWLPWMQCRWNHGGVDGDETLKPVLHWGSMLRPGNALGLPGTPWPVRELTLTALREFEGSERTDLLVRSVRINHIRKNRVEDEGISLIVPSYAEDAATVANGALLRRESTIELRGGVWNGTEYDGGEPTPEAGQAGHLLAPFADLYHSLRFSLAGADCDWSWQPLELVNVTDGPPGFDSAWAVIQTISRDLRTGRTEIEAGPPSQLGAGTARNIVRPNRLRKTPDDAGMQTYGFKPDDEDPTEPRETLEVTLCDPDAPGGEVTRQFYVQP